MKIFQTVSVWGGGRLTFISAATADRYVPKMGKIKCIQIYIFCSPLTISDQLKNHIEKKVFPLWFAS